MSSQQGLLRLASANGKDVLTPAAARRGKHRVGQDMLALRRNSRASFCFSHVRSASHSILL
jgi:hypothetical protein